MAAYAAVMSLTLTINNIQNHPHPPIYFHPKHLLSLTQTLPFLLDFLERYSTDEVEELERRITAAAHAAEDVIETHIVALIEARSSNHDGEIMIKPAEFYDRAIQELDLIKREATEISEARNKRSQHHHTDSSPAPAAPTMVDFDDVFVLEVLDKLVGQQFNLQIIPIVGMEGIGKTTFARNIYSKPLIVEQFDILPWVVISQECSGLKILLQVLAQENKVDDDELDKLGLSNDGVLDKLGLSNDGVLDKLGLSVYQKLWDRRYLIVMDDIWSSEPWDEVKRFFPDNNNGSRIMITTRNSHLAFELSGCHGIRLNFLDEDKSWDLLCRTAFGKEPSCPVELEETGKAIARKCRGLPLSVVVIGGVLRKSNMTRGYWEYTLENLNSLINLEEDEYCYQVLRTSYKALPVHLKPCLLYMGIFPEDQEIKVSDLVKMWVAEGIVKPIDEKSLEEAAEEYLRELTDRNVIMEGGLSWYGKVKACKIHDVLRDVCIREAQRQRFYYIVSEVDHENGTIMERRVCINILPSYRPRASPVARSFFFNNLSRDDIDKSISSSRVLRFAYEFGHHGTGFLNLLSDADTLQQINSRCISLHCYFDESRNFCHHLPLLWNLQTFAFKPKDLSHSYNREDTFEIWKMPLLRHAKLKRTIIPDPVGKSSFVLEHLQTLSGVVDFNCDEETLKRIPNIKKLKLVYRYWVDKMQIDLRFNNLHKLQTLAITVFTDNTPLNVTFPISLQKLSLWGTFLDVEELNTKIGSLPLLQFLKIGNFSFRGRTWDTGEAQFCSLKHLQIDCWDNLLSWIVDATSFPRLEHLLLKSLGNLYEISSGIVDIPTLKSIRVERCSPYVQEYARRIKEEQEAYGNEHLQLVII